VELYLHSPIYLHGVVINFSPGTTILILEVKMVVVVVVVVVVIIIIIIIIITKNCHTRNITHHKESATS
jgi:hypothetical protein